MRPLSSITRDPPLQLRLLIFATLAGEEMFEATLEKLKFGWLNASSAAAVNVNFRRSVTEKVFAREMLFNWLPGPSRIFTPEFPSRPAGGATKQAALNH